MPVCVLSFLPSGHGFSSLEPQIPEQFLLNYICLFLPRRAFVVQLLLYYLLHCAPTVGVHEERHFKLHPIALHCKARHSTASSGGFTEN